MLGSRPVVFVALFVLRATIGAAQDASGVLDDVARTIGAVELKTLQYSGTGFVFAFGQNYRPDAPYPKFQATYSRVVDFERRLSREENVRTQFENPPRGGGGQPLYRDAPGAVVATENSTWGGGAVELTPHGFVKAAASAVPIITSRRLNGRTMTVISFTARNQYRVDAYVNGHNLIERIDTWTPNPILGDTLIETTFTDYRSFGGIQFPSRIVQQQGGFPTLDLAISEVRPNATVALRTPSSAPPQPARAEGQLVAPGVWYLTGAPEPNSQLVEFRDYTVLIESSVSEGRALANLAEARRLVPSKPVRYHVNSHHHGDHAAGVRAFVSEGATIITHQMNRRFYEQTVLRSPHTLAPDALSRHPRRARFIWVNDKYVLSDGTRTLEIYHVPNGHTANLLMCYIPQEKLLLITDIFNDFGEPRPNDPPPGLVSPYYAALGERIRQLKLDVRWLAPSHGKGVVAGEMLWKALQGTVQAPLTGR